jgi:hypothetical protein
VKKVTFEQVERKRRELSQVLRQFRAAKGRYHNPAPELPAHVLEDCQVLPGRLALLDKLDPDQTLGLLGVANGDLAAQILYRSKPAMLHLFDEDLSRMGNPDIRAELASEECRLKPHVGGVGDTLSRLPDAHFDVFYINGDHAYDAVKADIERVLPKIKPGGAMIFHSYTTWSAVTMYHCGVARAVHEFCLENPWRFRYLALEPMMYNDVMLVHKTENS